MKLIAHRGASKEAPENTLAAFRLAWGLGADGVELDVRLTRDQRVVVIHDENTLRTTGVDLQVADAHWPELAALRTIPQLADVLSELPAGKRLMIEIKCGVEILPVLREVIQAFGRANDLMFLCFDADTLSYTKTVFPGHGAYLNVEAPETFLPISLTLLDSFIRSVTEARFDGLSFGDWPGLNEETVRHVKKAGLGVAAWTVDSPARARELEAAGVDYLLTNDPRTVHR